jgi:hypothetical protein
VNPAPEPCGPPPTNGAIAACCAEGLALSYVRYARANEVAYAAAATSIPDE